MNKALKRLLILPALLAAGFTLDATAKDYLLAVTRPNKLYLIDAAARKVEKVFDIPGDGIPATVAVPADGKVAYILTNRWESISGINLQTGQEVFRADMSTSGDDQEKQAAQPGRKGKAADDDEEEDDAAAAGDEERRVKSMFAMNVSRDGKELYVHQIPVRLKLDEYQVQDTQIAVYDTAAGRNAQPKRVFPAPRRIAILLPGQDRKRLYALGWDLYAINAETGTIDKTWGVLNWQRPNYGEPDVLDFWLMYEQANVFSTPYFVPRTDVPPTDPAAMKTGLLTFDLKNENFQMRDFENTSVVIFSSVINPVRPSEAFGVYTQLTKVDMDKQAVVGRVDLDHTYYAINISSDGKEVYVGGAMNDIGVYDAATLKRIGEIKLPGGADQSVAGIRVVQR
jgi:quinohemoprotein amine dehydrogenase beta subunit